MEIKLTAQQLAELDEEFWRIYKDNFPEEFENVLINIQFEEVLKGIHSCPKCTSEPYHRDHVEAECEVCHGMFWLDEDGLPFNPDKEVRHGEILRSVAKAHTN